MVDVKSYWEAIKCSTFLINSRIKNPTRKSEWGEVQSTAIPDWIWLYIEKVI